MEVAYEILIDALKKYAAEIIATGLVFVTFWLWRRYKKKIISGMKFFVLFVLAVIVAVGLWFVAAYLGGAFVLGFGSGALVAAVIWAVSRVRSRKSEDIMGNIPITDWANVEWLIASAYSEDYHVRRYFGHLC